MLKRFALLFCLGVSAGSANAASVSFSDVIGGGFTQFNGFEGLGVATGSYGSSYTEGGIRVDQVNGQLNDIWTTYTPNLGGAQHFGNYSWYPNGGDNGYTRITEQNGADFTTVTITTWNGWNLVNTNDVILNYELRNNGVTVLSGSGAQSMAPTLVSFYGGGFDEILLSATTGGAFAIGSGEFQALAIDNIKTNVVAAIPEPGTYAMLLAGLCLLGFAARRRRLEESPAH